MTVPIVAPRFSGVASDAANGTICWATVALAPTTSEAMTSVQAVGAIAARAKATASTTN
ncbi:hypothetical protein D3C71_1983600 [compost metagenome]